MTMTPQEDKATHVAQQDVSGHNRFEEEASQAVDRLRLASSGILRELPRKLSTAAEFADHLGLSRKLGWQVWTLATASNAAEAIGVIPGRGAISQFLKAAKKHKVGASFLQQFEQAARGIDALVEVHAGDRSSLDTLLQAIAGEKGDHVSEATRRSAFRANSDIFGFQTETWLSTTILWPGSDPKRADVASLHGRVGLRRLRPNVPCVWPEFVSLGQDESSPRVQHATPLVPDAETQGAPPPMIPEFCSKPIPFMRLAKPEGAECLRAVELIEGPIGDTGTVTCVTGEVIRNCTSRYATPDGPPIYLSAQLEFPARLFIGDLIVHRDLTHLMELDASVLRYGGEHTGDPHRALPSERLPVPCAFEHLGAGLTAVKLQEMPRYLELIDWTCRKLGWDAQQLEVHRVRLSYPVTPSRIVRSARLFPPQD